MFIGSCYLYNIFLPPIGQNVPAFPDFARLRFRGGPAGRTSGDSGHGDLWRHTPPARGPGMFVVAARATMKYFIAFLMLFLLHVFSCKFMVAACGQVARQSRAL